MGSANERRRYYVTPPLIGWAHVLPGEMLGGNNINIACLALLCVDGLGISIVITQSYWGLNKMVAVLQATFSMHCPGSKLSYLHLCFKLKLSFTQMIIFFVKSTVISLAQGQVILTQPNLCKPGMIGHPLVLNNAPLNDAPWSILH